MIQNLHWDLSTIGEQEYEELLDVMSANPDNKMMSAEDLAAQWNSLIKKKGGIYGKESSWDFGH